MPLRTILLRMQMNMSIINDIRCYVSTLYKRIFDFILVFCTLAIIWPIFLIITLWLYFANRGAGVFFLQNTPR